MNEKMLMTTEDAAFYLSAMPGDVTERVVRGWIAGGYLPAVKVGAHWRLDPTLVLDLMPLQVAAETLQISVETVREHLRTGQMKGRKLGRRWFVSRTGNAFSAVMAAEVPA